MANAVEKKDKPSFIKRVGNFFVRIGRYFKNMWHELKKVSWPSKKDVFNYSLVVFAFMVVMGVIILTTVLLNKLSTKKKNED